MKPSKLLNNAFLLLGNGKKWIKGAEKDGEKMCSIGALRTATRIAGLQDSIGKRSVYGKAKNLLDGVARATVGKRSYVHSVIDFNDRSRTTFADVKSVFTKAIRLAKKAEAK